MEAVILTGLPGAGKSTFYFRRFFETHLRINLDMLRTRRREALILFACLAAGQRFVVDNTNPAASDRARYIGPAIAARFRVAGYFFPPDPEACLARNAGRAGRARVPDEAIRHMLRRIEPPRLAEGFSELHAVELHGGEFAIRPWP